MKILRCFLMPLLLTALASTSVVGQQMVPAQLAQANQLHAQGQPRAAIAILEPMLRGSPDELSDVQRGIAWNMLGSAYQSIEAYVQARRCYETSMHILREITNAQDEYASVIDNLGSLEVSEGDLKAARALRAKSGKIYEMEDNHNGLSTVANNLALIDLTEKDVRGARKQIDEAFRQAKLAKNFGDNDYASMYILQGAVTSAEGDPRGAIAAYEKAIELWTRSNGPNYYMLGTAYSLRGNAFDKLGDSSRAIADLKHALALFEGTPGRSSATYLMAEIAYARVLGNSGSKQEAARLEKEAKEGIAALSQQQCRGCTISAEGFR